MSHMAITEFCIFFFICFTILMYGAGLGSFPPAPIIININLYLVNLSFSLEWASWVLTMILITSATLIIVNLANAKVLGTGADFDTRQVTTIIVGLALSGGLGGTMMQMLPSDTPLVISFLFIIPFVGLMAYSIIIDAGTHN
jgi:hypothetical protein